MRTRAFLLVAFNLVLSVCCFGQSSSRDESPSKPKYELVPLRPLHTFGVDLSYLFRAYYAYEFPIKNSDWLLKTTAQYQYEQPFTQLILMNPSHFALSFEGVYLYNREQMARTRMRKRAPLNQGNFLKAGLQFRIGGGIKKNTDGSYNAPQYLPVEDTRMAINIPITWGLRRSFARTSALYYEFTVGIVGVYVDFNNPDGTSPKLFTSQDIETPLTILIPQIAFGIGVASENKVNTEEEYF